MPAGDRTRASRAGSEHSRKEPARQLICWLFGTTLGLRLVLHPGLYRIVFLLRTKENIFLAMFY